MVPSPSQAPLAVSFPYRGGNPQRYDLDPPLCREADNECPSLGVFEVDTDAETTDDDSRGWVDYVCYRHLMGFIYDFGGGRRTPVTYLGHTVKR